jgi:hypothetical protein
MRCGNVSTLAIKGLMEDVLDFALAADKGCVGVHFDKLFG